LTAGTAKVQVALVPNGEMSEKRQVSREFICRIVNPV
jgi:hypothetical protein